MDPAVRQFLYIDPFFIVAPIFSGVLFLVLVFYVAFRVPSSFTVISLGKREVVALYLNCLHGVMWLL